jgi:hypothetical protein
MRRLLPILGLALLALSACGGGGSATTSSTAVRLRVEDPGDRAQVRTATVQLRGTVRPAGAEVLVRGRAASVSGTTFTATVALEPGVNVIDVLASAGGAQPALTAVRIQRLTTVAVPDVVGLDQATAADRLRSAGLTLEAHDDSGGFFDQILGRTPKVCATDPGAGDEVQPGSTVVAELSTSC